MKPILKFALILALGASTVLQAGSALTKAAAGGDLTGIHSALKAGEGINEIDSNGWTALMWAVYYRQTPAAELLLEKGANPDLQSNDSRKSYAKGTTALMIAASDCQEDLAGALVRKNARKDLTDATGNTAETFAQKNECPSVLRVLGSKVAVNSELDALLKEIASGKNVNFLGEGGWTPLMLAVFHQDAYATKTLLGLGADPNIQSTESSYLTIAKKPIPKGTTALMIAARLDKGELAVQLMQKGANAKLADDTGSTAEAYAFSCDSWSVQDVFLDRSRLKKSYTQLVVAEFYVGRKASGYQASQCQEKVLGTLLEMKGFDKVEAVVEGKKYDASALLLNVEITKLEFPVLFGSPNAKFTVRLVDAATGSLEREQQFSLTSHGGGAKEQPFLNGVGSIIAEFALMTAGKAQPCEEMPGNEKSLPSSFGFGGGPVFVQIENRPSTYWQIIEQMPTYPTFREESFRFAALRTQRIAVWPLSFVGLDSAMTGTVLDEYGTQDKFLAALSLKLSTRWLSLAAAESLGTDAVRASLGEGESKVWLDSRRILPWVNSHLLAKNQLGPGFDALAKHPRLQGIRYLILPHHLRSARIVVQTGGAGPMMAPTSSARTRSSLGVAIIDLSQGRVVWNGAFTASASSNWMEGKALHENEDGLLEALEKEVRGGK